MKELLDQEESGLVQDLKLSYSRISAFDTEGPGALIARKELSGEGITIGGLVDLLLFEPDKFKEEYYEFKAKIPTASTKELADNITNNFSEIPTKEAVYELAKKMNLWSTVVKEKTYYNKFDNDEFWGYLKAVFESKGKTIVSSEDREFAEQIVNTLRTHEYSKDIVDFPEEGEDKYVQLNLEFKFRQFVLRGIVDLVIVNHDDKTVRFIDLKTGANGAERFSASFVKYRYYLQALIYNLGAESFLKEYGLEGYSVLPFQFLYISRYEQIPLLYTVSDKWMNAALAGFKTQSGYEYKGLLQLLDEIDWHWTKKEFRLSKETVEGEGRINLNDEFIEVNE